MHRKRRSSDQRWFLKYSFQIPCIFLVAIWNVANGPKRGNLIFRIQSRANSVTGRSATFQNVSKLFRKQVYKAFVRLFPPRLQLRRPLLTWRKLLTLLSRARYGFLRRSNEPRGSLAQVGDISLMIRELTAFSRTNTYTGWKVPGLAMKKTFFFVKNRFYHST